ncbi:LysR family transcriptional regulator [Mesorhizobium argentiipisi]|uniref:LysR family transcriptional regulator n=1 Tax=Mesorhizobium argentiipisi TaxID=3015175 RepID=A0ABU8KI96_9HYPH
MEKFPPLNAMRTFEVAARAGSFTLAASELGVSSAAVSQQVRNLEDWFGKQLFVRNGNRIALTDAGHAIYPQTAHALGEIAAVGRRMLEGGLRTRLVVSVPFSLAELWLAPRLAVLLDGFPQMAIDVRVEDDPVDVMRQNIDLRISYGDYHYPALKMVRLVHDEVLPVAAPEFWQRYGKGPSGLADVHESHFIHTNWGPNYASHPSWVDWFAAAGDNRAPDPSHGRRVGLSSLAIGAARLGAWDSLGTEGDGECRSGGGPIDCAVVRLRSPWPALLRLHAAGQGRARRYCRIGRAAYKQSREAAHGADVGAV